VSQQTPYGPPAAQPPYPAPGEQQPGLPAPGQPQRTNTMAILGLVFAFVFSPLGIVFSAMGLNQTKKRGEGGRGLAITGLVLSIVFLLIGIAIVAVAFTAATKIAENPGAAAELFEEPATDFGAGDLEGVPTACEVIMPAMEALESDMATVTTPEEYAEVIGVLRSTIEAAAAASGDALFADDVQALSDDLGLASDAVVNGEDPTYLENALAADGAQVGTTCGLAGWTE
jgi:hypothetical protein